MRRARQVEVVKRVAIAGATMAAIGWLIWPRAEAPVTPQQAPAPVLAAAKKCESFGVPVYGGASGPIGERAKVEVSEGSALAPKVLEPCRVVLALTEGRVVIHAFDLGGGELSVETPEATAIVHGTVFAVERRADRSTVEVKEGVVEVRSAGKARAMQAGESWESKPEAEPAVAPPAMRPSKREPVAIESADELVIRANQARIRGELAEARELFAKAGRMQGATAEAAWLALARMETEAEKKLAALDQHDRRFPNGDLAPEATKMRIELVDPAKGRGLAEKIVEKWPDAPQAKWAKKWLDEHQP